ncbi:MAG: SDR family oxidoreductase [Magnetococcales bacterium]|nr:SDR family oxidoreductase [Magnetococcales bacterium]
MNGRTVLITGASRGIGAEIARVYSERGACVVGTKTTSAYSDSPCAEWLIVDFTDSAQIRHCAEQVKKLNPDILINNAGINKIGPFVRIDPEDFLRIQQINVFAPFLICQAVIPAMKSRGWGRIVNISSIWGKIGKEYRASYASSKFALDGLTIAISAEHSQDGILANCIAPGFTDTELTRRVLGDDGIRQLTGMVPMRRMASSREIAEFAAWLGSDENTYITGQNIAIDGGFTRV